MQWYYSKNGNQLGPISADEIKAKLSSGEIGGSDLVWKDGMADWLPSSQVAELRSLAGPVGSASASSGPSLDKPTSTPSPYSPPTSVTTPSQGYPGGEIPNYLWQSIVVTILCCWPLGIPAIVFAAKVDGLKARGDMAGALDASKKAKMWTWIAFGCGLAVGIIYILFMVFGVASGKLK